MIPPYVTRHRADHYPISTEVAERMVDGVNGQQVLYRCQDVEAELARHKRAIEWCLKNGADRSVSRGITQYDEWDEIVSAVVPDELKDLVK